MPFLKKIFAEFIGTFALVFVGCGAIMVSDQFPGSVPQGGIALVFGLIVAAMIYSVGHISGAHFNPAVTFAFAVGRHFPGRQIMGYWLGQIGGAVTACGLLSLLLPSAETFGATVPHVESLRALGWEVVLSFFLMFVIAAVATDTRAEGAMAGTAIGMTVVVAALIGGPVTGASMNPARSLAPAIFAGRFDTLWIYLVGPSIGAVLAVFAYRGIRCSEVSSPNAASGASKSARGCC